ncbi:MAG: porin family protein [Bacteroidales bacterium]
MKKITSLLSFVLVLMISTQTYSQFRFGVKTGLNISNMRVSGFTGVTESSRISFHIGANVDFSFTKSFSLESGLLLSSKGANFDRDLYTDNTTKVIENTTLTPLYIELPINAVYKVDFKPIKLLIFAGPYLGIGVGGNRVIEHEATGLPAGVSLADAVNWCIQNLHNTVQDGTTGLKYGSNSADDLKSFDFGLNFGAGIEFYNFQFRLQYGLGLANLNPTTANNEILKNNVFGISVGYMFGK